MSSELLERLVSAHVLNPTPVGDDVVRFYVEFDELNDNTSTEGALRRAIETGRRTAVVGPSGVGKSSLIEWVIGAPDGPYAGIRVPVSVEHDDTVSDPRAFAQHVIRTVSKHALDSNVITRTERNTILRSSSERITRPGQETTTRGRLGMSAWFFRGDLGREVKSFIETIDQDRSGAQIVASLAYVINLIEDRGLRPLFVIDDSDTWLRIEGVTDRSELVNEFFGRVLRMLAELPCGLVVAVHDDYLRMPGYHQAAGFLETSITVPRLSSTVMLATILERRLNQADDAAILGDAFTTSAIEELLKYYSGPAARSVRKMMQVAQGAVQRAVDEGAAIVEQQAVEAAISEWV
jgi:energy-coupling factor transporter ATP-binding protein EcfA2